MGLTDQGGFDEYILKEMYVPVGADNNPSGNNDPVDLVFVHGLQGNLRGTWKQVGTHEPWFCNPDFLGSLKNTVRVLSFGYDASVFGEVADTRIIDHANALLRNLVLRRLDCPERPLIFIAHSLGGLVVKKAIVLCPSNRNWADIKSSTKSIVFMGTPHMGAEQAEKLVTIQTITSLIKPSTALAKNLSKELKVFSNSVMDISKEFTVDVHRSMELLCCYESHPQRLPGGSKEIIVPQWSAVLQGVQNLDLNCTHTELSKFSSPDEPRFELFWGEIRRLVKNAQGLSNKRAAQQDAWIDEPSHQPPVPPVHPIPVAKRRAEQKSRSSKVARASLIRSSANEIIAEVRSRVLLDAPIEVEETAPETKQIEAPQPEVDPKEVVSFLRQLRRTTPDNLGLDRQQPHWKTCKWIQTDPTFIEWQTSEKEGILFITGGAGCGKSHLAKSIQAMMEKSDGSNQDAGLVVSFYCDSLESSRADPPILDLAVRSLLEKDAQLFHNIRQKVRAGMDADTLKREAHFNFNVLMGILQALVTDSKGVPTCLIIDGLDQCTDEYVLKLLRGLDAIFRQEGSGSALKIVITARLSEVVRGFTQNNFHINVVPKTVEADIKSVVDEEVDRIFAARQITAVGRESVSAVIVDRANGSFLFADSVLKELWTIKDTGASSVFTLLTSCPPTMEAIYQQDMDRLEKDRPDLFKLIQFLALANKSLNITEAREILRLQNQSITENHDIRGDLTRFCPRLVRYGLEDGPEGTLELLHQTLYDFISNTYSVNDIHAAFAKACLTYLRGIDWDPIIENGHRLEEEMRLKQPFLLYAASWLGKHIKEADEAAAPQAVEIWQFLRSKEGAVWYRCSQDYQEPCFSNNYYDPLNNVVSPSPSTLSEFSDIVDSISSDDGSDDDSEPSSDAAETEVANEGSEAENMEEDDERDSTTSSHVSGYRSATMSTRSSTVSTDSSDSEEVKVVENDEKPRVGVRNPIMLIVNWNAEAIFRALFSDILQIPNRSKLQKLLRMVPYISPPNQILTPQEFRAMINAPWGGDTAGHQAAVRAEGIFELLLPFIDDLDLRDDTVTTMLMLGAYFGHPKVVDSLLAAGADVNCTDHLGRTALWLAVDAKHPNIVRSLLKHGANPKIANSMGFTLLQVAIRHKHLEIIKILLDADPEVLEPAYYGPHPLLYACDIHAEEAIEIMLPYIDVNLDFAKYRLIHYASGIGWEAVVTKLIELQASLNHYSAGLTPVMCAVSGGHGTILEKLLDAGAVADGSEEDSTDPPLCRAVLKEDFDMCQALLRSGCSVNAKNIKDEPALYLAVLQRNASIVELLVKYQADPDEPTKDPPLLVAAEFGDFEIVKTILSGRRFPKIDAEDTRGRTALGAAARNGDTDMVNYLLDHGADVNAWSGVASVCEPLHLAIKRSHQETAIELLKAGARPIPASTIELSAFHEACSQGLVDAMKAFLEVVDAAELVNLLAGYGETPLVCAAGNGKPDAVKLLLDRGADPNFRSQRKNYPGATLLHHAAQGGNVEVMELLMEKVDGASVDICDDSGATPLFFAHHSKTVNDAMVEYLLGKGARTDMIVSHPERVSDGENIIFPVTRRGKVDALHRMIEADPNLDTDKPRSDGIAPLLFATIHGYSDIAEALLKRGADINRRCRDGEFALSEAMRYRDDELLDLFLAHDDVDLTLRDEFGRTALQIAIASGSKGMPEKVLKTARARGVDTQLLENRDMFGMSAYDYVDLTGFDKTPWDACIKGIHEVAHSLLTDFSIHDMRWELLGKYLLRVEAKSLALVAFQRMVKVKEWKPLWLEHGATCRSCFLLISGMRFTCRVCCNVDLCDKCVDDVSNTWMGICHDHHQFYAVRGPWRFSSEAVDEQDSDYTSTASEVSNDDSEASEASRGSSGLSPIIEEEEEEEEEEEGLEGDLQRLDKLNSNIPRIKIEDAKDTEPEQHADGSVVNGVPDKPNTTNQEALNPEKQINKWLAAIPTEGVSSTLSVNKDGTQAEEKGEVAEGAVDAVHKTLPASPSSCGTSRLPEREYIEVTEEQLREYLKKVLGIYRPGMKEPRVYPRWYFSQRTWSARAASRGTRRGLRPSAREERDTKKVYSVLSVAVHLMGPALPRLPLTGFPVHGWVEGAAKRAEAVFWQGTDRTAEEHMKRVKWKWRWRHSMRAR
ncbi:hypothetical protein S40293_01512 [Stachybotrys chartarum IBT 40293]|nr:hypothetical protein S40293_01512 [Stachybotrys chartarum IBT 40293]